MTDSKTEPRISLFQRLKQQYKGVDVFGQPITFFYEGEEQYKSYFGASLTFLVIGFVFLLSITIIKAAMLRNDVEFKSDNLFLSEPGHLNLTTSDFHIALLLDDPAHVFNHSMIGLRVRWANYFRLPNGTLLKQKTVLPMGLCEESAFSDFKEEYTAYRFNVALCPQASDISLNGVFLSQVFQFLEVLAEECDDAIHGVSGIKCAPKAERDIYFSKSKVKVQVYFKNYNVKPSSLHTPFQPYIDNIYYIINQGVLSKSVDVFIRDSELISFEDFLNSETQITRSTYTVDTDVMDQVFVPTKDKNEYLSIQFRKSQMKVIFTRTLTNLADLAAHFGGIWGMLYGVCGILAAAHNSVGYQKSLADKFFRFDNLNKPKEAKKPKTLAKPKRLPKIKNAKDIYSKTPDPENPEESTENNLLSRGVIKEQTAFGSALHYFMVKLCCIRRKADKLKLIQQEEGLELAKKKIDVLYIVKKLEEFEKFKYVLLDESQRALFDYIPPPLVSAKEIDEQNKRKAAEILNTTKHYDASNEMKEKYRTTDSIMKLYDVYKKSRHGDALSRKLVDMLGYKILAIFKFMDISKNETKETTVNRLKGIRRAAEVMRQRLQRIRERKLIKLDSTLKTLANINEETADNEESIVLPELPRSNLDETIEMKDDILDSSKANLLETNEKSFMGNQEKKEVMIQTDELFDSTKTTPSGSNSGSEAVSRQTTMGGVLPRVQLIEFLSRPVQPEKSKKKK